jgi:hypothetical protein
VKSVLALLCAALGAAIAAQLWQPPRLRAAQEARPPQPVALPAPRFERPDEARFGAVTERNLFHPSRRSPEAAAAAPAAPAPAAAAPWRLGGVLIMEKRRLALLQQPGSTQLVPLAAGAVLDGWLLQEVRADRVLMSKGGVRQELPLQQ